jgi:hypothetical protein
MISSKNVMMFHVEAIALTKEQHTRYYSLTTIGKLFSIMQIIMWPAVMIVRGWENLLQLMRCLSKLM